MAFVLPPDDEETPDDEERPEAPTPSETERVQDIFASTPGWRQYQSIISTLARDLEISPLEFLSVLIWAYGVNPPAQGAKRLFTTIGTRLSQTRRPKKQTLTEWVQTNWDTAWGTPQGVITDGVGPESVYGGAVPVPPKQTPPTPPKPTDEQIVAGQVKRAGIKQDVTDPEVRLDKNGNYIDPRLTKQWNKGTPLQVEGIPGNIRSSDWFAAKRQWGEFFRAYGQKDISDKYLGKIIREGLGEYSVSRWLAGKGPDDPSAKPEEKARRTAFQRSAIWKSQGAGYKALWEETYGRGVPVDNTFVTNAILNGWDDQTFRTKARARTDWVQSNTHAGEAATMRSQYEAIYGKPDQTGLDSIQEATLAGWTPDQFAVWLRGQPEYSRSLEFTKRMDGLSERLGFLTGVRPSGYAEAPLAPGDPTVGTIPDDPRIGPATPATDPRTGKAAYPGRKETYPHGPKHAARTPVAAAP